MRSIKSAALFIAVFAFLFATESESNAARDHRSRRPDRLYGQDGRIVIRYSPVLGINVALRVFIDGRGAGGITKGHTYVAYLPPGRHVITVSRNGRLYESSDTILNVRPGQTYSFIAKYRVNEVILVRVRYFG